MKIRPCVYMCDLASFLQYAVISWWFRLSHICEKCFSLILLHPIVCMLVKSHTKFSCGFFRQPVNIDVRFLLRSHLYIRFPGLLLLNRYQKHQNVNYKNLHITILCHYILCKISDSSTHIKISQLVNKMYSQQACQQVVTMLLFYQVITRLSLTTCWQIVELQDDNKLLEQLATTLLTICQQAGNKQYEHILLSSYWNSIATSLLQVCYNLHVLKCAVQTQTTAAWNFKAQYTYSNWRENILCSHDNKNCHCGHKDIKEKCFTIKPFILFFECDSFVEDRVQPVLAFSILVIQRYNNSKWSSSKVFMWFECIVKGCLLPWFYKPIERRGGELNYEKYM